MLEKLKQEYRRNVTARLLTLDREIIDLENTLDRSSFMKPKDRLAIQQRFEVIELEKAEIEILKVSLSTEIEKLSR